MLCQPPGYTQFPSTQGHILAPQSGSNTLKYTYFGALDIYTKWLGVANVYTKVSLVTDVGGGKEERA